MKAAVSVDATDVNGETALIKGYNYWRSGRLSYFLFIVSQYNFTDTLNELIDAGADVNFETPNNKTALICGNFFMFTI